MKVKKDIVYNFYNGVVLYPFYLVILMWVAFYVDVELGLDAYKYGVFPRDAKGLLGVILSPFIHGSLAHLYSNTLPIFFLGAALFYFYRKISWKVLLLGYVFTGLVTWVIGRPNYHIGMSGVIYFLSSFIFFKGIIAKHYRLIAVSLIVVFVYGGTIWYVLPIKEELSWEGHLAGFLVGFVVALLVKVPKSNVVSYQWEQTDYIPEQDPFMRHFDAQGNFVSESEQLRRLEEELQQTQWQNIEYTYIYKEHKSNKNDEME